MRYLITIIVFIALILTSFYVIVDYAPTKMVPILMYDHIGIGDEENILMTSPRSFEWQMKYLWKNRIKIITLDELISYYKKKQMPPKRSIVITFNNGYKDFMSAYPILSKYKIPATVFLVASKVGKAAYLDTNQISNLAGKGLITFGSQGVNGKILTDLPFHDASAQIFNSRQQLANITGLVINYFAYPEGKFNKRIRKVVKEAKYLGACSIEPGRRYSDRNIYSLKRTRISNKDTNAWSYKVKIWGNFVIVREWLREKFGK